MRVNLCRQNSIQNSFCRFGISARLIRKIRLGIEEAENEALLSGF